MARVEMDLSGKGVVEIREYASDRGIAQIAWVKADGTADIELLS